MLRHIIEKLEKRAKKAAGSSLQAQIAQQMDWVLVTGMDAASAKPVQTLVNDADKSGAEVLQDSEKYEKEKATVEKSIKMFQKFLGTSLISDSMQVVCGRHLDQDVYIFPGSESGGENRPSKKFLDLVVLFNNNLGLKLHMYPEYWYSKVGKALFRLQDIHIGHEDVDGAFMIKSSQPKVAQLLLRKDEILGGIRSLLNGPFDTPIINDVSVRNKVYLPVELDSVLDEVKRLAELAAAISKSQSNLA